MQNSFHSLKIPFFTIIFIFVGLFLYTKLFGPISFSINSITTTKTDVFSVEGMGKAVAPPDRAEISLGITTTKASVKEAQNQANTIINSVIRDLKSLQISDKDVQTTNYSVYPNYDYQTGRQQITSYSVSVNILVKAPVDKANDVIDTGTRNGANIVGGVQFTFADETKKKLEEEARKEAVGNAKTKAESLAKVAGIKLGKIINVTESSGFEPRPIPLLQSVGRGGESEPTKIEPGESTIAISVTLTYETQ